MFYLFGRKETVKGKCQTSSHLKADPKCKYAWVHIRNKKKTHLRTLLAAVT